MIFVDVLLLIILVICLIELVNPKTVEFSKPEIKSYYNSVVGFARNFFSFETKFLRDLCKGHPPHKNVLYFTSNSYTVSLIANSYYQK